MAVRPRPGISSDRRSWTTDAEDGGEWDWQKVLSPIEIGCAELSSTSATTWKMEWAEGREEVREGKRWCAETLNSPRVRVPVLSKTTQSILS